MSDTWTSSSSTDWFTNGNWDSGTKSGRHGKITTLHSAPTISATGTQSVTISGSDATQPVINPNNANEISVAQTIYNAGAVDYTVLTEAQIDGNYITLTNGADLSIQGIAMGVFYGNSGLTTYGTMSGLHGATTTTPSFDSHMSLVAIGNDTLSVETINENFGQISVGGTGNTLTIYNTFGNGANAQALHGLDNYGLITIGTGGHLTISSADSVNSTVANFYNAGWIVDNGGTMDVESSLLDGANTIAAAGKVDGYIEIGGGGDVILAGTVSAAEQVDFTDASANTLQITAGSLFSGTVNDFGATDTIAVNGFTVASNATITTVNGVTELVTTNGSVLTTITLTGSITANIATGTNSSGQEVITGGGSLYSGGTTTLIGTNGTATNSSTITVTGTGSSLTAADNVAGTGVIFIDHGATVALDGTSGNDAGQTVSFGTHGSIASPNTLIINDNSAGFGGHVTGFGANDDIILGGSALPALTSGEGVALNYSNNVLTISETSAAGSLVASSTVAITGTAGLSTASFVALESAGGLNIELAPTTATSFTFSAAGTGTGSFEAYGNYTGGVAPGDVLSALETVTIAAGTASVSTAGGVTDNGNILVESGTGFTDAHTLAGTGTLNVAGSATLTGGIGLGSVVDNGALTVSGNVTAPVTVASGAQLTATGNSNFSGAVTGAGTLTVGTGVTATLATGSSLASVLDGGTLDLTGSMGGVIDMQGNGAGSVVEFTGIDLSGQTLNTTITNFGSGDTIVLDAANFNLSGNSDHLTESYNSSTGQLTITDTSNSSTLTLNVSVTSGDAPSSSPAALSDPSLFTLTDVGGKLELTLCFYPGTALADMYGTKTVETIAAGDYLMTTNGAKRVRWVGQNHIHTGFADPLRSLPICIRQGALGGGLPVRDLRLSPDHAICIDGILVQASALVNGRSIFRDYDVPEQFTYYHVELETHELLVAEGVAAESFVDNVDRMNFHNWDERADPATPIMEMDLPRAKSFRQLPAAIRRQLELNEAAVA